VRTRSGKIDYRFTVNMEYNACDFLHAGGPAQGKQRTSLLVSFEKEKYQLPGTIAVPCVKSMEGFRWTIKELKV
jgi:hypothetical protein